MYEQAAVVRQQVGLLRLIAWLFNDNQHTLVPVEQRLLEPCMLTVQAALSLDLLLVRARLRGMHAASMLVTNRCLAVSMLPSMQQCMEAMNAAVAATATCSVEQSGIARAYAP